MLIDQLVSLAFDQLRRPRDVTSGYTDETAAGHLDGTTTGRPQEIPTGHPAEARPDLLRAALRPVHQPRPRARRQLRQPEYFTGPKGAPLVRVPVANTDQHAVLDAADFDRLVADGVSTNWSLNRAGPRGYVSVYDGRTVGGTVRVARLIMRPAAGWVVAYRTSNRLDLRRGNLWLRRGRAPGQALKPATTKA